MADFEIRTDTSSLAERRAARKQRNSTQWIIIGAVAACLVFVGLMLATTWSRRDPPASGQPADAAPDTQPAKSPAVRNDPQVASPTPATVVDDGHTMWVSPTSGAAIDLGGLPPGCEMFVALRPAALLASGEGEKILAALGPRGSQAAAYIQSASGLPLTDIDRLLIGLRASADFTIGTTLVVTPRSGVQPPRSANHYALSGGAYSVASTSVLDEVREFEGLAPPLRREMESLVAATDRDRHATLLASPTFLFSGGRSMWHGSLAGLRDPLFALLPDSTRGAAISFHAGDDFFVELRLVATIDQRPKRFAQQFANKVANWPAAVEREIATVPASNYSAAVVARLPAMLRALHRFQRVGVDDDQSLLRVYLPQPAGHNLLMAGELLLAERMAGGGTVATTSSDSANSPRSLEQRLAQPASLSFARDTLETAVDLLADEIGAEIILLGGDLQLDGITKNQSFGLDEQGKPAREILVAILRLANPDKTASGPADPKQKLVYTFGKSPRTGEPAIFVTTRAQADKRGDALPAVFTQ